MASILSQCHTKVNYVFLCRYTIRNHANVTYSKQYKPALHNSDQISFCTLMLDLLIASLLGVWLFSNRIEHVLAKAHLCSVHSKESGIFSRCLIIKTKQTNRTTSMHTNAHTYCICLLTMAVLQYRVSLHGSCIHGARGL